ncbi:MAG: hypothetical protein FWB83_06105 [Treponema sp.]|nr:hypothetical protein [Treponema sp.]
MALSEKSAASHPAGAATGLFTFSDIVDRACEGLKERQIKFSIKRIQEMEEILSSLEEELTLFIHAGQSDNHIREPG